MDEALNVIEQQLINDDTLEERTLLRPLTITNLIRFCMRSTHFGFAENFYKQVEGAPMGSPLSPIIADLYMEHFEQEAITLSEHKPCKPLARRYFFHMEAW